MNGGGATRPVVLYPSPGMGHLVSMIELGKTLGARGLPVTIVVIDPPYNTGATAPFLAGVSAANPSISFHRLPKVPALPPVASQHQEALTFAVVRASDTHLRAFLASARPSVLVIDFFCSAALVAAAELGVPAYFFFTSGAACLAFFLHLPVLHAATDESFGDMGDRPVRVPGVPPIPATHAILPLMDRADAAYDGFLRVSGELCCAQGVIVNTFRALEPRAVDAVVAGQCTPPGAPTPRVYCIGPLIKSQDAGATGGVECLAWLDAQPERSVVFLCFGSLGRFGAAQIRELAAGLEASGQRFLWVVRAPPGEAVRPAAGAGPGRAPARWFPGPDQGPRPRCPVVGTAAGRAGARGRRRLRHALRMELGAGGGHGGRADARVAALRGAADEPRVPGEGDAAGRRGGGLRQRHRDRARRRGGGQGALADGVRWQEGAPGAHAGGHAAGQGCAERRRRVGGHAGRAGGQMEDCLHHAT